jgi:tRNA (cytidine/uridine-2'-O-)-methyltransferase
MALDIVLFEPEIPPNTGNIIRICANTGARLHLIEPLGFEWSDTRLKRAGLDYHEHATVARYANLDEFKEKVAPARMFALSTKGTRLYTEAEFSDNDAFMFGPESRGLPANILNRMDPHDVLRIPMRQESRSLNLANAVSVVTYEAWRQLGFIAGS